MKGNPTIPRLGRQLARPRGKLQSPLKSKSSRVNLLNSDPKLSGCSAFVSGICPEKLRLRLTPTKARRSDN
jgi:hypothetical protein